MLSSELIRPDEIIPEVKSLDGSFESQPDVGISWLSAAQEYLLVPPTERLKISVHGIQKWKELGPLRIEEIMEKTNVKQPDELFMPGSED